MRLFAVTLFAVLAFASPAFATTVTNVAVDNTAPSSAAGARTVYAVTFKTSATGGLPQTGKINFSFPADTTFPGWSGGSVTVAGIAIGNCSSPNGLNVQCGLFSNQTVAASTTVAVTLSGVTNAGTEGARNLAVSTTVDMDLVNAPFNVASAGALSGVTLTNASPSAAAGARTNYVLGFTTSPSGGLAQTANSRIDVIFPIGTTFPGWFGGTITVGGVDVGNCSSPNGPAVQCSLFSGRTIAVDANVTITFAGVTNSTAGTDKVVTVSTTSDPSNVNSNPFSVLAASPLTSVTVANANPSAASGARTNYVLGFATSGTGGLAQEANGKIDITFPAGTTFPGWFGGTITVGGVDVGNCGSPSGLAVQCGLFSGRSIAPGAAITMTFAGVTNSAAGTGKVISVSTTSDQAANSAPFNVVAAGPLTGVTVANANPTSAAGARTNYVLDFTTSATGGLAQKANSKIDIAFPAGTTFPGWSGGTVTVGGVDVGNCSSPSGLNVQCGLFTDRTIAANTNVTITFAGVTNAGTGVKRVSVTTTSDSTPVESADFNVVPAGTLTGVTLANADPSAAAGARTRYVLRFTTSATGRLAQEANGKIDITFPAGTTFPGWFGGTISVGGTDVGNCSSPSGLNVQCGLFTNRTIAPNTDVTITFAGVTNATAGTGKVVTVSTTSNPAVVSSAPFVVAAAGTLSGVGVTAASLAASAHTRYVIRFVASATGGMSRDANSRITITFPAGTTFPGYSGGSVLDVTRGINVGNCASPSGLVIECSLFSGQFVAANDDLRITFADVANPAAIGPYQLSVSTTSDPSPVTSSNYAQGDTDPPDTAIDTGPTGGPTSATRSFTFSSIETSFECRVDSAAFTSCTSPHTTPSLPNGSHTFEVRALDVAGNPDPTPAVRTFTITATAPAAPTIVSPAENAALMTSTLVLSGTAEVGSTVQVLEDTALKDSSPVSAGGNWSVTLSAVPEGQHTYTARAVNPAGTGPATNRTLRVDLSAPDTTITSPGPTGSTNHPSFTFSSPDPEATFECHLDSGTFVTCVSPRAYTGLSDGEHTFAVRAVDAAGNPDPTPETRGFFFDGTAPDAPAIASPADNAEVTTATVTLSGTAEPGSSVAVREGAAPRGTVTGTSGNWSLIMTGVANGTHAYEARATDAAGNVSAAATRTVRVAVPAPAAPSVTGPSGTTTITAAEFAFGSAEPGVRLECSLDGGAFETCTSPKRYGALGAGGHTFSVRAVDAAGIAGPSATQSWAITQTQVATPTPTATPTPSPTPEFRKDVVVAPVSGTVEVCDKPGVNCRKLAAGAEIPMNSTVDARRGVVELSSITSGGVVQKAKFYDGMFKVAQSAATTDLTLNEPLASCSKKKNARAAGKKPKSRRLWGDGQGKFRTRGQYSAATIRGTKWLVQDSCAGTLTQVKQGVVSVRDEVKKKTVTLRAGKRYLAKPR